MLQTLKEVPYEGQEIRMHFERPITIHDLYHAFRFSVDSRRASRRDLPRISRNNEDTLNQEAWRKKHRDFPVKKGGPFFVRVLCKPRVHLSMCLRHVHFQVVIENNT
ncbi:hypothetical protein LCGC14_2847270 [marine sediment metagenome]|uniref:Uncharacterized protein n=1 Tax=marine sediment metagenome TaxID=412755 RepID=A0A0F9AHU6_9ZZZZ